MSEFLLSLMTKESIIHLGALFYLSGFLCRNQILLRSLIVMGDIIYVLYFYFAPQTPLWGGIFWSTLFVIVNLWMLWQILADRRHYRLGPEERRLFDQLGTLSPGQFRTLLRLGRATQADGRTELTRQGEAVEKLYYLTEGTAEISIEGHTLHRDQSFIGELAFLTGHPASATVTVGKGARYISWPGDALKEALHRQPELEFALQKAMNRDMADKVAGRNLKNAVS